MTIAKLTVKQYQTLVELADKYEAARAVLFEAVSSIISECESGDIRGEPWHTLHEYAGMLEVASDQNAFPRTLLTKVSPC